MFSSIIKFICSLFRFNHASWETDAVFDDFEKEIKNDESNDFAEKNSLSKKRLGQGRDEEYDVQIFECFQKTGKVTFLCDEYGLIDEFVYFDIGKVPETLTLREGNEVVYSVYKGKENETENVFKIDGLKNDFWDFNDESDAEIGFDQNKKEKDIAGLSRTITGKIIERKGRKFLIEPLNIWCDLEKMDATFVPMEGDWVSLEAIVAINKDAIDLAGDVMEITSLKPLLSKSGLGRITIWLDVQQEGAIENYIFISKKFCQLEFMPGLGDEVVYDAIECDLGLYKWRALKVTPTKTITNTDRHFEREEIIDLLSDKNEISIRPRTCRLKIELNGKKDAKFEISNEGSSNRFLMEANFQCEPGKSQLRLKNPIGKTGLKISPNETVEIVFECRGKFLGLSEEICFIEFDNFKKAVFFAINVAGNEEMNKFLDCKSDFVYSKKTQKKLIRRRKENEGMSLIGPKPWSCPKFVARKRTRFYNIPEKLWNAVLGDSGDEKNECEIMEDVEKCASFLKVDMNSSQYAERFHTLLFLEEIEVRKQFMRYKQQGVFPFRKGDYLALEMPDLSEQRPSLIAGDKIILTQPWSEKMKNVTQIGYIFEVRQKEILVKFHESFHHLYDGSECDVEFEPSSGSFARSHEAIDRAVKELGHKWLFPTATNEKPSQIDFDGDDSEGSDTNEISNPDDGENFQSTEMKKFECDVDGNGYVVPRKSNTFRKKLNWFNVNLNARQKLAVRNVLKGRGRPLPYVIFGPPGTGKTSTLVEIVLQVYHLIPGSRLLVTSPSNSSADLICERLIEMGKFKPGQLVRLMAFSKVARENVPLKLVPHSMLVDIGENAQETIVSLPNGGTIRRSAFGQLVGRHRITVGTCTCVGSLHYMAFPPGHFTHILVDEAGQATEPDILIAASEHGFQNVSNGQVVLVGDPQQLGPICFSKTASAYGLGISLMKRLLTFFPYEKDFVSFSRTSGYDPRFVTKLRVNYRSVPEILSLPNRMFYDSELISTVSQTTGIEADILKKVNIKTNNRGEPSAVIFHGIMGQNYQESDTPSWFNPHEVWQTVTYLRKLYDVGLTCDDIGIITPYRKQVEKIKFLLNALDFSVPKIGTVENFQGQERQVIIVSTVRSCLMTKSGNVRKDLGFLSCPKRINVILTRAKALLIILGNPAILSRDSHWKTILDYCLENDGYTGCNFVRWNEEKSDGDTEANKWKGNNRIVPNNAIDNMTNALTT